MKEAKAVVQHILLDEIREYLRILRDGSLGSMSESDLEGALILDEFIECTPDLPNRGNN